MPLIERDGDMFKDAPAIAHGCNTMGVMGAGVAKVVRDKFPTTYVNYRERCKAGFLGAGDCFTIFENGTWVFNLMTQRDPGANANLVYIRQAFSHLVLEADFMGIPTVHIPHIGCGIGGLTWNKVSPVIFEVVRNSFVNIVAFDGSKQ